MFPFFYEKFSAEYFINLFSFYTFPNSNFRKWIKMQMIKFRWKSFFSLVARMMA